MVKRLVGLLVVAGCSAGPAHTPQAFCAAQAARDPAVKALILSSVSNPSFLDHHVGEIAAAKATAERACLKRQGVLPAGEGVQAPPTSDTLVK